MKNNNFKILGLDPGFGRIGYAVILNQSDSLKLLHFGCLETDKKLFLPNRLKQLADFLDKLLLEEKPQLVAMEKLFFAANTKTALEVSEARGVMLSCIAKKNLLLTEYTPAQVKLAVTGDGRADKKQIQKMLRLIFKLTDNIASDDAADAVAVAVCAALTRFPSF